MRLLAVAVIFVLTGCGSTTTRSEDVAADHIAERQAWIEN
jgi:outer membrane biogenesis lipoprotein LolB